MPTFKFKNGETIEAATLEEARTKRNPQFAQVTPPNVGQPPPAAAPQASPSPPPALTPAKVLTSLTGQAQLLNMDPKAAASTINTMQGIQGIQKAERDPKEIDPKIMDEFRNLAEGSEISDYAAQMKKKNNLDTGPMMWMKQNLKIPFIPGTDYANLMDLDKEKAFGSLMIRMTNPYRKLVTGAQASEQELEKFIMPALPQISDNDKTWEAKNNLFKAINVYNMRLLYGMLKAQGKDVTALEKTLQDTRMPGMDGKPMAQEDDQWTQWALGKFNDAGASEQEKSQAVSILKANNIDPAQLKSLPNAAKEHPEWFQGDGSEQAQKAVGDADLRTSKKVLGQ